MIDLADQYDSPRALASGMQHLARLAPRHAVIVFAIAAAHGNLDVCRLALRHFNVPGDGRPMSLLIPAELAEGLAPAIR